MGVIVIPPNPTDSKNILGTLLGQFIGSALDRDQAKNDRIASIKATEIINNMKNNYTNPTPNDSQVTDAINANGYKVGENPYEKIANASKLWGDSAAYISGLQEKNNMEGLSDGERLLNTNQIAAAQAKQKEYENVANRYRDVLGKNNLSIAGFGAADNAAETWNQPPPEQEQSKNFAVSKEQLMNLQQVAAMAKEKAAKWNADNYSPSQYASDVTKTLMENKINPNIIKGFENLVTDQGKNIGVQYAMQLAQDGDYTKAAEYVIKHGLPTDTLQAFQALAPKHNIEGVNTGKTMTFVDKSTNNFGQATVPQDVAIGTTVAQDNADARQKEALRTDLYKFEKNFDQHVKEFGFDSAVKKAELVLKSNKFTLDQKEHIAGKVRAGIDVIKTENDNLMKQLIELNKMIDPNRITPAQQEEVNSIKAKINENNANLSKYGAAVDNSLGIENSSSNTKSGKITDAQYDKAYNYLVNEKKYTPEQAEAEIKRIYW